MSDSTGNAPLVQFPRAQLRDMITGITEAKVIWNNEPIPFVGERGGKPGYYVELAVIATKTKGVDDERSVYDPINQVNDVTQISVRIYTVQVKVVSYNKDIPSFDVLDQIRRGLRSDTAHNEYMNIGLALVDWDDSRELAPEVDNRTSTQSVFSVKFSWSVSVDPGDANGGVILGVGSKIANSPADIGGINNNLTS